jgi:uncharacterized protein YcfJ
MLVVPFVLLFFMGHGKVPESQLLDFSRFTEAIGAEIAIVDREGIVREGVVTAASADDVTMSFSGTPKTFSREVVASGERLRDGRRDGLVKGAVFGALVGLVVMQGYSSGGASQAAGFVSAVAIYSGIGWALDAAQNNREPIYRSPAPAPAPGVKLSVRF